MTGRAGIKLHTGEPRGPNLLPIALIKGLQAEIPGGTIVECNVLYPGPRYETASHREFESIECGSMLERSDPGVNSL